MARLIIGHTTDTSVRIWVRGESRYPHAFVTVCRGEKVVGSKALALEERHFFTGAVDVTGLSAETRYTCTVRFAEGRKASEGERYDFGHCSGQFVTFPPPGASRAFSFLLGSCNLHSIGPSDKAFETLAAVARSDRPAFMIHCGDQIYYDLPNPMKRPSIPGYRAKYVDAWGDSRATRSFLTRMPQYMILDDHEIVNDFANDMETGFLEASPSQYKDAATMVYREFVHVRQPDTFGSQALYYTFSHGAAQFFVLDTRSERYAKASSQEPRIVGPRQMEELASWLVKHKTAVKLVVTSVPFVGEVRNSREKWNAPMFKPQREALMKHLLEHDIGGVVFLTGDMHNAYHATLELERPDGSGRKLVAHELMSGPINHVGKSSMEEYESQRRFTVLPELKYRSRIVKFYDQHSNAMIVGVRGRKVSYEIFRTKTNRRRVRTGTFSV